MRTVTGWQIALAIVAVAAIAALLIAIISPRHFVRGPFRVLLGILYRRRVVGLENLPREGGCVVVSNHVSWIDGILILWMLPRNVRFVVDGENFNNGYRRYLAGAFDTILMLSNPKSIGRALKAAREGLIAGDVIGVVSRRNDHPHGTAANLQARPQTYPQRDRCSGRADVARWNVGQHLQFFRRQVLLQVAQTISSTADALYRQAAGRFHATGEGP